MASEFVFEVKTGARTRIQLNIVFARHGDGTAVGRDGMVDDWMVEEVMDFGRSHGCRCDRRNSLLPLVLKE